MSKEKEKETESVHKAQMNFRNNLFGIIYFVNHVGPVANEHDRQTKENVENIKKEIKSIILKGNPTKITGKMKIISESKENNLSSIVNQIIKMVKEYDFAGANVYLDDDLYEGLLFKSSFIMMIASFDCLVADLLYCHCKKHPGALGKDMVLSLDDLRRCADIDEALEILTERHVDKILFKNFGEQIEYFREELKIETSYKLINWDVINEAIQRRNILVHNDGIINRRYMRCVKEKSGIDIGQRLDVTPDYFIQVYWQIYSAGVLPAQNCWRKWFKDDLEDADSDLIDCINRELHRKSPIIAGTLLACYGRLQAVSQETKFDLKLLECQLYKMLGRQDRLLRKISEIENTTLKHVQLAAVAAIKNDKRSFLENAKIAIKNGEMEKSDFDTRVIYEDFQKDVGLMAKLNHEFADKNIKNGEEKNLSIIKT